MRSKETLSKQNDYNRQKYDKIGLMLPKGVGEEWKAIAKDRNISLNAFVQEAVKFYLENCTKHQKAVQNDKKEKTLIA